MKSVVAIAVTLAASFIVSGTVHAQGFGMHYQRNSNWGNQNQLDWNVQRGVRFQNPRAAAIGGILAGIGNGLSSNPKNQVASGILGGIGNGIMVAGQPTIFNQGSIRHTNQGYRNDYRGINVNYRPAPRPTFTPRPMGFPTSRPVLW